MERLNKLSNYAKSIDREEIKKYLAKDISDSTFDNNLPEIALIYMVSTDHMVDMNYIKSVYFEIFKDREGGESEAKYRFWKICLILTNKIKMDIEAIKFQEDFIDWETFSARSDLTLEVIEKFNDKIDFTKIRVDFGKNFISRNLANFGSNVSKFKLSKKNADDLINSHGYNVFSLKGNNQFNEKLILRHLPKINVADASRLISSIGELDFTFEELMMILDSMESVLNENEKWNELIVAMLDKKYLTLQQKKEIKYRCDIICDYYKGY